MKDTKPDRLKSIQRASCPGHHQKTTKHIKILVLVASLLALSLTVFGCGGGSGGGSGGESGSSVSASSTTGTNGWDLSYQAGYYDAQSQYAGGTEILWLTPHNGKLYAAVGYYMDTGTNGYAQILRLDAPNGQWQVDLQMGPYYPRAESLRSVTFTTDGNGNPLAQPVNLLVAGAWSNNYYNAATATLFVRDDTAGKWTWTTVTGGLPSDSEQQLSCRTVNTHRDRVTGVDRIFFDVGTKGIWSGVYDPGVPGKIRMDPYPETQGLSLPVRVMAIIEANNSLLFSSGPYIYRRNDGASPSYALVANTSDLPQGVAIPVADGIRGMTTIPNPEGTGDSILFAWMDCIYRLDPDGLGGYTRNSEACLASSVEAYLGLTASWVLAAYNDMLP